MTDLLAWIQQMDKMTVVDLTHELEEGMPVHPKHSRYFHTLWDSHETGSPAVVYQLIVNEHCGTHMDATGHFLPDDHPEHRWMSETPVSRFFGRALTLDFSGATDRTLVTAEEIRKREDEAGAIREGDFVLFHFGWDRYWAPRTESHAYTDSWPGISGEAAEYLVSRGIRGVGCDTLAIDRSDTTDYPAHHVLLGNGKVIVENLTRLQEIIGESFFFAAPLKIREGSGSPVRALAFLER